MLRIAKTQWIKPDHISHIMIGNGQLSLTDIVGVTFYVEHDSDYLENVCSVFAMNLGEVKVVIQNSKSDENNGT